jgi:restriction endonuclease
VPTAIFAGKNLYIDNYRYEERQRLINVKKKHTDFCKALEVLMELGTGKQLLWTL